MDPIRDLPATQRPLIRDPNELAGGLWKSLYPLQIQMLGTSLGSQFHLLFFSNHGSEQRTSMLVTMLIFQGACVLLNPDDVWQKVSKLNGSKPKLKNISFETETHPILFLSGCEYIANNARGRNCSNPARITKTPSSLGSIKPDP